MLDSNLSNKEKNTVIKKEKVKKKIVNEKTEDY